MAVPKKRTSKTRKNKRKYIWKTQATVEAKKALSQAKRVLKQVFGDANNQTTLGSNAFENKVAKDLGDQDSSNTV